MRNVSYQIWAMNATKIQLQMRASMDLIFNKTFNYIKKYRLFDTNDFNEKQEILLLNRKYVNNYPKIRQTYSLKIIS